MVYCLPYPASSALFKIEFYCFQFLTNISYTVEASEKQELALNSNLFSDSSEVSIL